MKRWILLLILVIPIVYGENFDEYKDVTLEFEINSGLNIIAKQGGRLESLTADLKLIPENNRNQEVLDMDIFSSPQAEISKNGDITYLWRELNSKYIFGLKSRLKIRNNIVRVGSRVKFPNDLNGEHDEFLQVSEFIDLNSEIRRQANEILEGETDYYVAVFKLSDWIRTNIEYDLNSITAKAVKKSSWVLDNRQGVCDELTNLFISMSRSVGIPARFVTGTVFTGLGGGWGNHGWAEVYFPGSGWIPWDVTFGQFGWVDPSHVRLGSTVDSGESSVDYKWRSSNVEVKADNLELKTKLFEKGKKFDPLVRLQVKPIEDRVNFGSYLVIGVTVENLQDYYLSDKIILTKGPKVDKNVKIILLKPKEIKTVYWITRVPDDLDRDKIYTSILEVRDSFSSLSKGEVFYSSRGKDLDFEEASLYVENLEGREEKKLFTDLGINCGYEDRDYFSDEEIDINCKVKNLGNVMLNGINFCLDSICEVDDLGIGESKSLDYIIDASDGALFVVDNDYFAREENLRFSIVQLPNIYVTEISPSEVDYGVMTEVQFFINSDTEVIDVLININGVGEIRYDRLVGKELIEFSVNSKKLTSGLNLDIFYEDLETNRYDVRKSYPIIVKDVPFYARWWGSLRGYWR